MVRIRVPLVRPIVRCTLKRTLRVMPSVLLLLFVFSLIFVTLMQIAVIHSHRRTHYVSRAERNETITTPSPQQPAGPVTVKVQPPTATKMVTAVQHKRPETLRVEAFLDKNAPSVEANIIIMKNLANTVRIKNILKSLSPIASAGYSARNSASDYLVISKCTNCSNELHSETVHHSPSYAHISVPNSSVFRTTARAKCCSNKNATEHMLGHAKPKCPEVPKLAGRLRVDMSPRRREEVEELLRRSPYMRGTGSWTPKNCTALHRVAIIIPYRDRQEHLATLLYTLHPLLQRQLIEYRIYVVEQHGNDTFNKGVLMNAGAHEALRDGDFHCFVFHDVDMIPEDDRNMYSCPKLPRHLSVAVDKFNYTLPYSMLVGGVFAIRVEHFLTVNGYSNLYWGWGGEDDDMAYRIKFRKIEIVRPPESLGRYTMIKHDHRPESPNSIRTALLRMAKKRSPRDGMNTVKYTVLWKRNLMPYTHLMIDIGKHHRWQFLNGQRLVINF